jgi:Plavaka transposase
MDYKNFLKASRRLKLSGIVEPFWKMWPLSDPSNFITPEVLHHFHWMFWDHDVKWCITMTGAAKLDFHFSIIQTLVGYQAFNEGISKLKQVTGHDHHAVQHYIIAAVAGSVPCKFLTAIHALLNFCYLAQAPSFTTGSIERVASALQEFHNCKDAIMRQGV